MIILPCCFNLEIIAINPQYLEDEQVFVFEVTKIPLY